MRGHVAVIKALLQKGAAVDAKTKVRVNCLNIKMYCALALAKPCPPPPTLWFMSVKIFCIHKNVLYWHT